MVTETQTRPLLSEIASAVRAAPDRETAIEAAMRRIAGHLPHYRWVGVYVLDGGMLNLGPYVGAKTEHTLIPVGRGVCGTAVAQNRNLIVEDVRALDNYLACSLETRSEIVVLIRDPATGQILGQIDADGHEVGAFDASDEAFLAEVAGLLAPRMWSTGGRE